MQHALSKKVSIMHRQQLMLVKTNDNKQQQPNYYKFRKAKIQFMEQITLCKRAVNFLSWRKTTKLFVL